MNRYLNYFAYGSNMHPVRLRQRVESCAAIDVVELKKHIIRFHKRSPDGSGKCNIFYTGRNTDRVYGVVYLITADDKRLLDQAEAVGDGYDVRAVRVKGNNAEHSAFAYFADPEYIDDSLQPYTWYKALVLTGARAHRLPNPYIEHIENHEAIEDLDEERAEHHHRIITELTNK